MALARFCVVLLVCTSCGGAPPSGASSPAATMPREPAPPAGASADDGTKSTRPATDAVLEKDSDADRPLQQAEKPTAPESLPVPIAGVPSPKPSGPPMAATTQSLSGRLNESQVGQVVTAGIDAFATCTRIDATVTVSLNIDAEGRVGEAVAARSEPDDAKMRDCVVRGFKTLKFPRSTDGRGSPVRFELRLSPRP